MRLNPSRKDRETNELIENSEKKSSSFFPSFIICHKGTRGFMKFKLPSVTLANYGTAVPGKYGQIKKLQIVFTGRYEA